MDWHEAMKDLTRDLAGGGLELPEREAQHILAWATGCTYSDWVVHGGAVSSEQWDVAADAVRRRVAREPWAYIVGVREFFGLSLTVTPHVLIPRPETELLVEAVLNALPEGKSLRVADIGTGSGAIALALLSRRPGWTVFGADSSGEALEVARANGERLGLTVDWRESDLLAEVPHPLDAIVANLPYIDPHSDAVDPELSYEPARALYADNGGLALIQALVGQAPRWIASSGEIFLECGFDQAAVIGQTLEQEGFRDIAMIRDYAGWNRVVTARWQ